MAVRDLDAVMSIEREAESAPHWSRSEYLALFQSDRGRSFKRSAIVAEVEGGVAGFAVIRVVGLPGVPEAELESIVVAPQYRIRGVGRLLLSESAQQAKALGATRLDLEVRPSNAAAIRLYRRTGFLETARRQAYYSDPVEDAVLMSVTL